MTLPSCISDHNSDDGLVGHASWIYAATALMFQTPWGLEFLGPSLSGGTTGGSRTTSACATQVAAQQLTGSSAAHLWGLGHAAHGVGASKACDPRRQRCSFLFCTCCGRVLALFAQHHTNCKGLCMSPGRAGP
jgi:hypothetical protein